MQQKGYIRTIQRNRQKQTPDNKEKTYPMYRNQQLVRREGKKIMESAREINKVLQKQIAKKKKHNFYRKKIDKKMAYHRFTQFIARFLNTCCRPVFLNECPTPHRGTI